MGVALKHEITVEVPTIEIDEWQVFFIFDDTDLRWEKFDDACNLKQKLRQEALREEDSHLKAIRHISYRLVVVKDL